MSSNARFSPGFPVTAKTAAGAHTPGSAVSFSRFVRGLSEGGNPALYPVAL